MEILKKVKMPEAETLILVLQGKKQLFVVFLFPYVQYFTMAIVKIEGS